MEPDNIAVFGESIMGPPIIPDSGLGRASSSDLGKVVTFALEDGWGWQRRSIDGVYDVPASELFYGKSIRLRMDEFVWLGGLARGVFGTIVGGDSVELQKDVLALTWNDGADYDLWYKTCPCWMLCFGATGYHLSDDEYLTLPPGSIKGWGRYGLSM